MLVLSATIMLAGFVAAPAVTGQHTLVDGRANTFGIIAAKPDFTYWARLSGAVSRPDINKKTKYCAVQQTDYLYQLVAFLVRRILSFLIVGLLLLLGL